MTSSSFSQRTVLASTLFALTIAGSLPAAATDGSAARAPLASPSENAAASPAAETAALRDAIWRLERLLRRRLTTASRSGSSRLSGEVKTSELADLLEVLRSSAGKRVATEGRDLARKAAALSPLLRDLEKLERAADATTVSVSLWEPPSAASVLDAAAGATCQTALDVADGDYQATIRRRSDGTGGERWLRYSATVGGMAVASTAGSDFDTVVDWFDSCTTSSAAARDHGDDEIGLQARAAARMAAGESAWIRIRGFEQSAGTAMIHLQGGAAGLTGTVTNESTGQPTDYRYVDIWSASGSYAGSESTAPDGTYSIVGLSPGTYYASTEPSYDSDGLLDELYDNKPCAGGALAGCSPTTGTPIVVPTGVIVQDIDFALGRGAAISGRVRAAATGLPLAQVEVRVYGPGGGLVGRTETDQAGRYLLSGLAGGTAFAVAGNSYSEYRAELYQNFSCGPSCNVTTGTPIPVSVGSTTAGVDFDLERLGAVAGIVTRVADGAPVSYGRVDVRDAQGNTYSWGYTNGAGAYVAGGLNAGTYFATTYTYGDYFDELYDNLPCDPSCSVAGGNPIPVALDHTTGGVDFGLRELGSISGLLTDAPSGDPLTGYSYLYVYDAEGDYAGSTYAYDGSYTIGGLAAGTYYVYASHYPYRAELYDDVPCVGNCDPTAGTPVSVALDADTPGIDFALTPLGTIAGTITDAASNAPAGGVEIAVWDGNGNLVSYAYSGNDGTYQIVGLQSASYFVTTDSYYFVNELYDNKPCPGGAPTGCDPTTGTSVAVSLAATTSGIDFALMRKGGIAGTIRDQATSAPLNGTRVLVYDAAGSFVAQRGGANDGTYEVAGLAPGTYFVIADSAFTGSSGYDAELYDNLPCPSAACNPTAGTPVSVVLGTLTTGIDFALAKSGYISGLVTDPGGIPRSYVYVDFYDANGQYRGNTYTDGEGRYQFWTEPGTWYLIAYGGSELGSQLYSGIPCNNGCNPTSGTPVVVTSGNPTPNIDFVLSYARGIVGTVTDHGHPLPGVAIDLWSAAGEHVASTVTGPNGGYHFQLDPGTYFVSTDSGMGAVEELWNNVACPLGPAYQGLCDPTTGTPVTVATWDSLVTGIDFALDGVEIFVNSFEPGSRGWSAWSP